MTDGIELSLFASRISAVCEEMGAALGRSAFSPNIRDRLDYSCALFDAQGKLLGQATHIPVHLGSMAYAMGGLVQRFDWQAGDIVVFNDPYQGGTHLPDVTLVMPVLLDHELIGFSASRAHHADIGADAPGSMPLSQSLAEEGIVIAPRLFRMAHTEQDWLHDLLPEFRNQAAARGDFKAQEAANSVGVKRLQSLCADMGVGQFERCSEDLNAYAERLAIESLGTIPNGRYSFTDYLDDDGFGQQDIVICVAIKADNGRISVDFEGTDGQVRGNLNCPMPVTAAAVYYVFRCLMPAQMPDCAGALETIDLAAPEGSLVNARSPAAVAAGNVETSMRIVDVLCGALAQALPERIPAASQGTMNNLAMGVSGENGWDYYETLAGGMGAGPDAAGRSARHSHMTNTLNTPIEVLERHYPLRLERYARRRGSGGAGRWQGGDGIVRSYLFLEDAELSLLSERRHHGPWGLQGGSAGATGENVLDDEVLPGKCQRRVRAGQRLRISTPGGGGFGSSD